MQQETLNEQAAITKAARKLLSTIKPDQALSRSERRKLDRTFRKKLDKSPEEMRKLEDLLVMVNDSRHNDAYKSSGSEATPTDLTLLEMLGEKEDEVHDWDMIESSYREAASNLVINQARVGASLLNKAIPDSPEKDKALSTLDNIAVEKIKELLAIKCLHADKEGPVNLDDVFEVTTYVQIYEQYAEFNISLLDIGEQMWPLLKEVMSPYVHEDGGFETLMAAAEGHVMEQEDKKLEKQKES